jgi:hypothetical protein
MFPLSSYVHSVSNLLSSLSTSAHRRQSPPTVSSPSPFLSPLSCYCRHNRCYPLLCYRESPGFLSDESSGVGLWKLDLICMISLELVISNLYYWKSHVNSHNGSVSNSISNVDALDPIIDGLIKSNGNDWNHKDVP